MFRKIQSNRDSGSTVAAELYGQFRPYLTLLRRIMVRFLRAYPRQVFGMMVLMVIFSVLFSFGVFRSSDKNGLKTPASTDTGKKTGSRIGIAEGLIKISTTGAKLRKTVEIRKQVDSVLARGRLNAMDTLFLETKLDELRKLR